ncbi:MAG: hypothetical protein H7Y01_09050 [Ferruginibacter sp.]|nr:hypothetical protein [Chitinophagaceae bacterium]
MDNSTPYMSEKLVQYLDGELSQTEKDSVEQQLAADQSLQDELDRLRSTREAVKLYGLQQKVAGIHVQMMDQLQSQEKKIRPAAFGSARKIMRYSIAVAASLLLIVGGYMAYNFVTLSSDKVFASRYRSYGLVTVRDGNTNETPLVKAYREKKYKEVVRIIDTGEDKTTEGKFLGGTAALELNDNEKAITWLKEVLESNKKTGKSVLDDEAEYYLSLGYIRNKDYDYALDLLYKIRANPNHLYNKKVTAKLIRQVKILKWR